MMTVSVKDLEPRPWIGGLAPKSKLFNTAVETSNLKNVHELINLGVNVKNQLIICSYNLVLEEKHVQIINLLVQHGAKVDTNLIEHIFETHNNQFARKLISQILLYNGSQEFLQMVFNRLVISPFYGIATLATLKHLLDKGLSINVFQDNKNPLHLAIVLNRIDFVSVLIQNGADIHQQSTDGKFPLFLSVSSKGDKMLEMLLEKGAKTDINKKINNGVTPLHSAICISDIKKINILLYHGASINIPDNEGNTPLMTSINLYNSRKHFTQKLHKVSIILIKNLAKLKYDFKEICSENLELFEENSAVNQLTETCMKELRFMNKLKVSENLSLYDVFDLQKDPQLHELLIYVVKNDDFVWVKDEVLKKLEYYYDDLKEIIEKVKKIRDAYED